MNRNLISHPEEKGRHLRRTDETDCTAGHLGYWLAARTGEGSSSCLLTLKKISISCCRRKVRSQLRHQRFGSGVDSGIARKREMGNGSSNKGQWW